MYRALYLTIACTFFSSAPGVFFVVDYMLSHKLSLSIFEKVDVLQNIFFDHILMKLEINNGRKTGKFTHLWKLNNILLSNEWIKEIAREI